MNIPGNFRSSWLSALVEPLSVDEFLSNCWLKEHLFSRGSAGRFSELLSWPVLNRILEHHWRETYRFRLARQGRDLEPASYADLDGSTPRIRPADVAEQLRCGATLSFDAIDEVHEPLAHLARAFEAFFRGGTQINVYAGSRAVHGLDLHRDDQEIFILQVDGRKRWLLYGFTIDAIDRRDVGSHSTPPDAASLDQVLTPGDLLYIPRGCYHLAIPMNEPTLHLTVGIKTPREADLLRWIVERRRQSGAADRDLPYMAGNAERTSYGDGLRKSLFAGLDADLVEQYVSETPSSVKPRPSFNLPWSATPERLPPGRDFLITLSAHAQMAVIGESSAGSIEVRCRGRAYRFPRGMRWIVEALNDGEPLSIRRLNDMAAGRLDEDTVRLLVGMLVAQDLAKVLDDGA